MRRATSSLAIALYSLVVAVFVAGFLARYVHPQFAWWLQLVAVGLPYAAIAVVLLSVPAFRFGKKRIRRLHTVLLLLVVLRFPPWLMIPGKSGADDLRVLTYNNPGIQTESHQDVDNDLQQMVEEANPHVFAMQETFWRFASGSKPAIGRSDILALVQNTTLSPGPDTLRERIYTHQPVLTTIGVKDFEQTQLRSTEDQPNPVYIVRVLTEWQGREVTVFNVHLASYGSRKPWREEESRRFSPWVWREYAGRYRAAILQRAWEAERVKAILDEHEGPFVVTGDFNATPHNWTYRHIRSGLADAMHAVGKRPGFTYHRRRPIVRIDFILASRELKFTSAQVLNGRISDHLAVLATVRWRDR